MEPFDFPVTQDLGEEKKEGVVYSVVLKRVRCSNQTTTPTPITTTTSSSSSSTSTTHLQWVSQKIRTVQAGTLERLVEHLAPQPDLMGVSHSYRTCFLCMYRSFADTGRVVELLVKRYLSSSPQPDDTEEKRAQKQIIQDEILSFLRLWLETYPQDFNDPPSYLHFESLLPLTARSHDLQKTIDGIKRESSREWEKEKEDTTTTTTTTPSPCETPDTPRSSPLFSMSPVDFTNALTTEDARIFRQVSAPQCIDYIRHPRDTANAPTVRTCIHHFNRVSLVVMATILGGLAPDARAFVIGQWIDIAQHCRAVKNFSSLKAIVCGLQSMAVFRLTKSWEKIPNSKLQQFQELSDILSEKDNHHMSRVLLNKEGTSKYADVPSKKGRGRNMARQSVIGVVPYLGTFLTDLTMVHSAHQDTTQDGLINFDKFRKQFQLLAELTLYQKSAINYCFDTNQALLDWLKNSHTASPSDSYELSRQLEPEDSPPPNNNHHHPHHHHHCLLIVPEIPLPLASPSRLRRNLRHIFNVKGSSVGDYTPSSQSPPDTSPNHSSYPLSISSSSSSQELVKLSPYKKKNRSLSLSPPTLRRENVDGPSSEVFFGVRSQVNDDDGRVVRVAVSNCDHLNYKSLRLSAADKAHVVIQESLKKLDLPGDSKKYDLFQVTQEKRLMIPRDANVYYALSNTDQNPTLLISPKT